MINKLKTYYRNIKYFLLNIYHHRKALWYSRPWDYTGTYLVLRDNLKYLSDSIEKYGNHLNKERDITRMRICIHLIDRLVENDYYKVDYVFNNKGSDGVSFGFKRVFKYDLPKAGKDGGKHSVHMQAERLKKQDQDMLFYILNKYITHWWD